MKNIKSISTILFIAGSSAATVACASTPREDLATDMILHDCIACTQTQAANRANALGRGQHYLYNLNGNILYLFSVECEPVPGGSQCYADSIPPAADIAAQFSNYHLRWMANGQSETFSESLDYSQIAPHSGTDNGFVNAYDTIQNGILRNQLLDDFLGSAQNHREDLRAEIQQLLDGQSVPDGESIVVVVTFNDRSKRQFTFNRTLHKFEPVPNSAIDSNQNPIPEQRPNNGTQYSFGGGPNQNYNGRNIAEILAVTPPPPPTFLGPCTFQLKSDGHVALTCPSPP